VILGWREEFPEGYQVALVNHEWELSDCATVPDTAIVAAVVDYLERLKASIAGTLPRG
jgi:hypothetical protein